MKVSDPEPIKPPATIVKILLNSNQHSDEECLSTTPQGHVKCKNPYCCGGGGNKYTIQYNTIFLFQLGSLKGQ